MRRICMVMLAAFFVVGGCGGDDDPSNAERPDDTTSAEVLPETTVPTPTAIPVDVPPEELTYTVQEGDLLGSIAQSFGLTLEELLAANPEIDDPNSIQIGDVITIPDAAETSETTDTASTSVDATTASATDTALPED